MLKDEESVHARRVHSFTFEGIKLNIFKADNGQGIPKHNHEYRHATVCVAGKIKITKENLELEMSSEDEPVVLREVEWHEIEAVEDNTVFINIFSEEKQT